MWFWADSIQKYNIFRAGERNLLEFKFSYLDCFPKWVTPESWPWGSLLPLTACPSLSSTSSLWPWWRSSAGIILHREPRSFLTLEMCNLEHFVQPLSLRLHIVTWRSHGPPPRVVERVSAWHRGCTEWVPHCSFRCQYYHCYCISLTPCLLAFQRRALPSSQKGSTSLSLDSEVRRPWVPVLPLPMNRGTALSESLTFLTPTGVIIPTPKDPHQVVHGNRSVQFSVNNNNYHYYSPNFWTQIPSIPNAGYPSL